MPVIHQTTSDLATFLDSNNVAITPKKTGIIGPLADAIELNMPSEKEVEAEVVESIAAVDPATPPLDDDGNPILGEDGEPVTITDVPTPTITSLEALTLGTNRRYDGYRSAAVFASFEDQDLGDGPNPGTPYDILLKEQLDKVTPTVLGTISFFKNNVLATIDETVAKATETVKRNTETAGLKFSIASDLSRQSVWGNPALMSLLNYETRSDSADAKISNDLDFYNAELADEDLVKLLDTGNMSLDAEISELLTAAGISDRATIARVIFDAIFINRDAQEVLIGSGNRGVVTCNAILATIMAINLITEIPKGVTGRGSDLYDTLLERIINYYSNIVKMRIEAMNNYYQSGMLIISWPSNGLTSGQEMEFVVQERLWHEFLDNGGTVDVLLGAMTLGHYSTGMSIILENSTKYLAEWERHSRMRQATINDEFHINFTRAVGFEIAAKANEYGLKIDNDMMNRIYDPEINVSPGNAYMYTSKMVVKTIFGGNDDYRKLLKSLNSICEQYEGISREDAMELTIIDWLSDWVFEHVTVSNV